MIAWHSKLFYDKGLEGDKKRDKIRKLVTHHKRTPVDVTGIFVAQNPDNILEMIAFNDMLLPAYAHTEYLCIGMASTRAAAEEMMCKLLSDIYMERGYLPSKDVLRLLME